MHAQTHPYRGGHMLALYLIVHMGMGTGYPCYRSLIPTDPPLEGATPWDAFLACLHFYKSNYKKYLAKFEKKWPSASKIMHKTVHPVR